MKQTIFIPIKNPRIDALRKKYDTNFKKIQTHVTLVYPFEVRDQIQLTHDLDYCLKELVSFEIVFENFRKSSNYLVLDAGKNQRILLELYKKLNSGILAGFENKDISIYLPHVTIGKFNLNEDLMMALGEMRSRGSNLRF